MNENVCWIKTFNNFRRVIFLLQSAFEEKKLSAYSILEQEGIIRRFKYALKLSCSVLRERMEDDGIMIDATSSRSLIWQAFNSKYIDNSEVWVNAIIDNSLLSHVYDLDKILIVLQTVKDKYLIVMNKLYFDCLVVIENK